MDEIWRNSRKIRNDEEKQTKSKSLAEIYPNFLQLRIFSLQTCGNTGTVDNYVP